MPTKLRPVIPRGLFESSLTFNMPRLNFEHELQQARQDLLSLGHMAAQAILDAVVALKNCDMSGSRLILEKDQNINRKRFEIEAKILAVIAMQQPAARDLRLLTAILDLCAELERIGDYAKGIATINLRSGGLNMPKLLKDAQYMSQKAVDMLDRSLDAFVNIDIASAKQIALEDKLIDALYQQIYFEVIDSIVEDPANMECANYMLWVGHNLERVADRATNVCERTLFVATGELKPIAEYSN
ncbi:MAG TPA: phosphate signaling complex protein PhoU [Anaerolineales bacterium]|nr:phosphate signaling complex protein PhoU [Anaerolineales bacterium]